jgi:hypothetical protein
MKTLENVDWKLIRKTLNGMGYKVVKVREALTTYTSGTFWFKVTSPQQMKNNDYTWHTVEMLSDLYCKIYLGADESKSIEEAQNDIEESPVWNDQYTPDTEPELSPEEDEIEEMVTITKAEYDRLIEADRQLEHLECLGVDNWSEYSHWSSEEDEDDGCVAGYN